MNDDSRFDDARWNRVIAEERRAFRRARRLDLKWAGVAYAVAILCGANVALQGIVADGFVGLWCAVFGARFLDRHFGGEG